MAEITARRRGEVVRGVFEVLLHEPAGLPTKDIIVVVRKIVPPTPFEVTQYERRPGTERYDRQLRFHTIHAVKAGWLVKDHGVWRLTDAGRQAHAAHRDPEEFDRVDALARHGHRARIQDQQRYHLDQARAVPIRPDLVVDRGSADGRSRPVAVVDMKYKVHTAPTAPNADLYQLLAYCTALGLSRGYLVYAGGGAPPRTHMIRNAGIEVVEHSLDLSAPPGALLAQVDGLASDIAGTPGQLRVGSLCAGLASRTVNSTDHCSS